MSAMETDYTDITVSAPAPHVLMIKLDRPDAYNALNGNLLAELAQALDMADRDPENRAVVLTGGVKIFAAGSDIRELAGHTAETIRKDPRLGYWRRIAAFSKPLIAAVNGYCLGGGNELAMHADIIIAGEKAHFGQPEINLGIMPGAGGTQRLLHAVGKSRCMQMVLTGEMILADEALRCGLVSEIHPPDRAIDRAMELAKSIAAKAPLAAQAAKRSVLQAQEAPLSKCLEFERHCFTRLFSTDDKREGVAAFIEKRQPHFKGQ